MAGVSDTSRIEGMLWRLYWYPLGTDSRIGHVHPRGHLTNANDRAFLQQASRLFAFGHLEAW